MQIASQGALPQSESWSGAKDMSMLAGAGVPGLPDQPTGQVGNPAFPAVVLLAACLASDECVAAAIAVTYVTYLGLKEAIELVVEHTPGLVEKLQESLKIAKGKDAPPARVGNPGKGNSPVWKDADPYRNGLKKKGDEIWDWDNLHNDIEVYDKRGRHLGSRNPTTGEMYKSPVPGRKIAL